ncbi:hypothetical protein SESBI_48194 [Sesbania bispinosa]|nr:hypothetical protein SESBI_48194 [Sesbania bispinosa]
MAKPNKTLRPKAHATAAKGVWRENREEAAATSIGDSGQREVKVAAGMEIFGGTMDGCAREAVVQGGHGGMEKRRGHRGGAQPRDYATVSLVGYTVGREGQCCNGGGGLAAMSVFTTATVKGRGHGKAGHLRPEEAVIAAKTMTHGDLYDGDVVVI